MHSAIAAMRWCISMFIKSMAVAVRSLVKLPLVGWAAADGKAAGDAHCSGWLACSAAAAAAAAAHAAEGAWLMQLMLI